MIQFSKKKVFTQALQYISNKILHANLNVLRESKNIQIQYKQFHLKL